MKSVQFLGFLLLVIFFSFGCNHQPTNETLYPLPQSNLVIAHRGTTYWAPEETEAAMRWARNMGADYLEIDLQMTKDSVLIALHDDNLTRTTDIATKFSDRKNNSVATFTYAELLTLDAGSWFSEFENYRNTFAGLEVLTLEDVIRIAGGYRIKRESYPNGKRLTQLIDGKIQTIYEKDQSDNGHRPGIYPETKEPHLFPGIEKALVQELKRLAWYAESEADLVQISTTDGKVQVANSPERVIVQTFSKQSLVNINSVFTRKIPTCFLLWLDPNDTTGASMLSTDDYEDWVNFGYENGARIIGPSIAGEPNNYEELLEPWMSELIKGKNMFTHAYSFDTEEQMLHYSPKANNRVNGWFTNRTEVTLKYISENGIRNIAFPILNPETVLDDLGY